MSNYEPKFCDNCKKNVLEGNLCTDCASFIEPQPVPAEPVEAAPEAVAEVVKPEPKPIVVDGAEKLIKRVKRK